MTRGHAEGGLPLISLANAHQVVHTPQVQLSKAVLARMGQMVTGMGI